MPTHGLKHPPDVGEPFPDKGAEDAPAPAQARPLLPQHHAQPLHGPLENFGKVDISAKHWLRWKCCKRGLGFIVKDGRWREPLYFRLFSEIQSMYISRLLHI